ncbi:DUF3833 domain-containing protein [Agitococcus lubricus]|uniref:Uncharacterized protein DUF3833 n=1 Tax=Agitococcus lubricus TaxID=1077255 RepID=A0A2T5IVK8_9GAMM|nr:DUF3833 domain-containing protein [Agitococcus lubricus]PTQ87903.1 uncharacterized protein DUF3833 [Agitococcus lubricus]
MNYRAPALLLTALSLTACSSQQIEHYQASQPSLDLKQFLNGELQAWGQFQDRSGTLVKRFQVQMTGTWQGTQGQLVENFSYDDGTKQQRIWYLTDLGQGRYQGRASDVVGVAQGQVAGSVLNWHYTLALPVNGKTYHVQFDDWMYLHDSQTLVNRATMSKFGFKLGEVTLFFRKSNP